MKGKCKEMATLLSRACAAANREEREGGGGERGRERERFTFPSHALKGLILLCQGSHVFHVKPLC